MTMAPRNRTVLTPEQLARFNMPYQDVLRQQWNQIPEVVEKVTPSSTTGNIFGDVFSDVGGFFEDLGTIVADAFANFGLGIKDTITMLMFLLVALILLYFVTRLVLQQRKSKK